MSSSHRVIYTVTIHLKETGHPKLTHLISECHVHNSLSFADNTIL